MNREKHLKLIAIFSMIVILLITVTSIKQNIKLVKKEENKFRDTVIYKDKTYVLLEYNMDIFTYHFNGNGYYEEDKIKKIKHDKWDIVYFNGDLFVLENQIEDAIKYYSNDKNYKWVVIFDVDDHEEQFDIEINDEELKYLYNLENMPKKDTMKFEDIKGFASIQKISDDNLVKGLISLANYDNSWYWKSEVMTDDDREYIIKLPDSLNEKIKIKRGEYSEL